MSRAPTCSSPQTNNTLFSHPITTIYYYLSFSGRKLLTGEEEDDPTGHGVPAFMTRTQIKSAHGATAQTAAAAAATTTTTTTFLLLLLLLLPQAPSHQVTVFRVIR